jgi:hypothetical protein
MSNVGDEPKELYGQAFGRRAESPPSPVLVAVEPEALDSESRVKRLYQPFWIGYERAVEVRARIEEVLETPYSDRITSCAVIAPSYNGKTSILRNVQRRHNVLPPDYQKGLERSELKIPVFFVQAPPVPDEDRLLDAILRILVLQGSPREPTEHKISRIQAVFAGLGVKLLAIDEFGFYQAGSIDRQRKALNGLKYLSNELKIPMVVASVEEGLNILSANSEIANRFPAEHLQRWKANDIATLSLLASFEKKLGLRKPSNLGTEGMAKLVIANTGGILGHMHDLLRLLAKQAIRTGAEQITEADLTPDRLKAIRWVIPSLRHQRPT